jgi:hypothetical protein
MQKLQAKSQKSRWFLPESRNTGCDSKYVLRELVLESVARRKHHQEEYQHEPYQTLRKKQWNGHSRKCDKNHQCSKLRGEGMNSMDIQKRLNVVRMT